MPLIKNHQISFEKWNEILALSKYASVFQTNAFYVLCNESGISAEVFALEEENKLNALCVVITQKESGIKGYFSRRAIIYGGPVLLNDLSQGSFNLFLIGVTEHFKRKAIYLEIRNYFDYSQFHHLFIQANLHWLPYLNVRLKLENKLLGEVLAAMKYNRRREIKLTFNEGAIYREASDLDEIATLYLILKQLYFDKVKLPLPSLEFFIGIFNSEIGKVFVVLINNEIIGGSFCLLLEKETIYTMYYCGLRDYQKNIFPTHLSILAAIEYAIKNKLKYLDFMGAGLHGKEYGVRKYKLEFGGELVEEGRYIKINDQLLYRIGEIGIKLLKVLKK